MGLSEGSPEARAVAARFALGGEPVTAVRYGSGHINDTFLVTAGNGHGGRFILQRLNGHVFPAPEVVMANVAAVTRHVQRSLEVQDRPGRERRVLRLVPTREGEDSHRDEEGRRWRCYHFVERARTHDVVRSPELAYQAARAFGEFQRLLGDYTGPPLAETVRDFHHTERRFEAFSRTLATDALGRAGGAAPEVAFALSRCELARGLLRLAECGLLPERITHNDTKVNNVLVDEDSGEAVCVVDLDTVMPGLALYDFGDLARTASHAAAEDETDLARVKVDPALFAALARGFLEGAGGSLNATERSELVLAAKVLTYEQGLRFLADHLDGDRYFRIHRPDHNLQRARTQFALLVSFEEAEPALRRLLPAGKGGA